MQNSGSGDQDQTLERRRPSSKRRKKNGLEKREEETAQRFYVKGRPGLVIGEVLSLIVRLARVGQHEPTTVPLRWGEGLGGGLFFASLGGPEGEGHLLRNLSRSLRS